MANKSLNKVMLIGNVTRDPDFKYTPANKAVCKFGLATNRTWLGTDGQEQEQVEFHNIVVWGKLSEVCNQYLHKGDKIYVEGRLQTSEWQAEDGSKRRSTEIVMDNMLFLRTQSGQPGQQTGSKTSTASEAKVAKEDAQPEFDVTDVSDDVPF